MAVAVPISDPTRSIIGYLVLSLRLSQVLNNHLLQKKHLDHSINGPVQNVHEIIVSLSAPQRTTMTSLMLVLLMARGMIISSVWLATSLWMFRLRMSLYRRLII